jgi:DNA-binding winged helix-turn-helix (wHTH) protein/tetratricopeptide (TPR) repeat protein
MSMKTGNLFRFGEYEVDALARTVRRQGETLNLGRRGFDVLLYFVQNPGRAISKDELLKSVWADAAVDENSLVQSISVLRKALDEKRGENSCIVTLPGRGYQFISVVQVVAEEDARLARAGVTAVAAPLPDVGGGNGLVFQKRTIRTSVVREEREALGAPRRLDRLRIAMGLGLALVAVSAIAYFWWRPFRPLPPSTMVVLADFENTTGDTEFDRFLNRVLQIDLEQSPFLNLLSRPKIQETLAEMRRKGDERLTPALAREICQRNNGQAMLHATLSKLGGSYLLLLDAEGCVSGERLGGYKAQVQSKEELLSELDKATGRVRQQLGESSATRERFRTPIAQATTTSLDALQAYSQGLDSLERGDFKTAEDLLKRAVALDPNFATGYRALATSYYNRYDFTQAAAYYKKAFDLRGATTERERLSIEALYYGGAIRNYEEAARTFKLLNHIYPNDAGKWGNLCNLYTQMGEYAQAIEAGRQALHLDAHSAYVAEVLARAYKRANAFAEAKQVAGAAVAAGTDRFGIHSVLFQVAYAEQDAARVKSEGEWGLSHQSINAALDDLAFAAATGGRLREALDDLSRARTEALRNGDEDYADVVLLDAAGILIDLEEPGEAAARLGQLKDGSGHAQTVTRLRAETGDLAPARRLLTAANPVTDMDTIHVYFTLPVLRATLALIAHQPAEAVRLIEPARPYQLRNFQVPYLRARAETEAGLLDAAARDYRLILNNQGVDPIAPVYSLAHLRLARVLVLQKKPEQAGQEYNAFLAAWKNADTDLPLLIQAKRESAGLSGGHP